MESLKSCCYMGSSKFVLNLLLSKLVLGFEKDDFFRTVTKKSGLIILFLLLPLCVSAQSWFTAVAVNVGNETEFGEWHECNVRVFSSNEGDVKVYAPDETFVYRRISDYKQSEDEDGRSISWNCLDDKGVRCILSFGPLKGMILLMIIYEEFTIVYQLVPNN